MTIVPEILTAKRAAGEGAYLWLHTSGDCILWPDVQASVGDDGARAIARWTVTNAEFVQLVLSGEINDLA